MTTIRFRKFNPETATETELDYAVRCETEYDVKLVPTHYAWTDLGELILVFRTKRQRFGTKLMLVGRPDRELPRRFIDPCEVEGSWSDEELEDGIKATVGLF